MRSASIALTAMLIAGLATPVFADTAVSIVDVRKVQSLERFGIVSPRTMKLTIRA